MRIRTFTAGTTPAAMALVRNEMGPTAVIIDIDQATNGHGVVVRAAIEETSPAPGPVAPQPVEDRLEALLKARLARPRPLERAA
jgi:flagellar biosynthesis protein FlhF